MEVFEAVRTVLAVRAYQDRPVPPETVRRIIEAHEGELQVESAPGEGSRFSLLIPMQHPGDFGGVRSIHSETAPIPVVPIRRRGMGTRRPPPEWRGR